MMQSLLGCICFLYPIPVATQQAGTVSLEESPPIALQHCTKTAGCVVEQAALVLDANWRWVHSVGGYENCYNEGKWDELFCPDDVTCKRRCALEGVSAKGYANNYGVLSNSKEPEAVTLKFMTEGGNVGSRLYVTDGHESYKMFTLLNREFTLDVDVSTLACGMNGAVYFIEMDALGGKGKDHNDAGAKYGTGYCDAQCPNDKFVRDTNKGVCCVEMDIWEANRQATAYTPHPCSTQGPVRCEGIDCGYGDNGERWKGLCDKDGCDMNAYRMGAHDFYGPGKGVDTTKPITVVTQFLTDDGTDSGNLAEIRRLYLQNGKLLEHANSSVSGVEGNSITDEFCNAQKRAFGDIDHHQAKGGLKSMGETLKRGMVLSVSVWDDFATQMRWLDSTFPPNAPAGQPGALRGPCDGKTSHPDHVRKNHPDASVKYSNLKYGEIGSTFTSPLAPQPGPRPDPAPAPQPNPPIECKNSGYAQCAGQGFTGETCCPHSTWCRHVSQWWSHCEHCEKTWDTSCAVATPLAAPTNTSGPKHHRIQPGMNGDGRRLESAGVWV